MKPRVLVHGGAGLIDDSRLEACIDGCRRAAEAGGEALGQGAIEAVIQAVKVLEEDPSFNAGLGATLTRDGTVELDAAVMAGDLRFGAVGSVPPIESAIELARRVMEDGEHCLLVGSGALAFAEQSGIKPLGEDDLTLDRARRQLEDERQRRLEGKVQPGTGTVGAVALDASGGLAAATSTGGVIFKRPGRVGDTPMIGAGTYADEQFGGAASATGHGEGILKVLLCRHAVELIWRGYPVEEAGKLAIAELDRRTGSPGGLILIGREGDIFAGHNTRYMPWASTSPGLQTAWGA